MNKCILSMAVIITLLDYIQYMPPAFYPIYAVNKKTHITGTYRSDNISSDIRVHFCESFGDKIHQQV
jgi:hypothetical protein